MSPADFVIALDKTGELCYWFAKYVKGADIEKLEAAVVKKRELDFWDLFSDLKFCSEKLFCGC